MPSLPPGFANPVLSAQSTFRCIMDALARPATVRILPEHLLAPRPLSCGAAAVALTLCDHDTPVWLDAPLAAAPNVVSWLRFHTGATVVAKPAEAAFAVIGAPAQAPPFDAFALGTAEYPDRSTTLILQIDSLTQGQPLTFVGPGIRQGALLRARPLPHDIRKRLAANRALFPRGIDLVLVTETAIAAIPRSARLTDKD